MLVFVKHEHKTLPSVELVQTLKFSISENVSRTFTDNRNVNLTYSVIHNSIAPSKELCSKMAIGEVGVSLL